MLFHPTPTLPVGGGTATKDRAPPSGARTVLCGGPSPYLASLCGGPSPVGSVLVVAPAPLILAPTRSKKGRQIGVLVGRSGPAGGAPPLLFFWVFSTPLGAPA